MDWKLELVVIPVTDVDRAKRFYSEQVGFAVDHDTRIGDDVRIVQLTPVGSARAELLQRSVEVSAVQHFDGAVRIDGRGGDWNSFIFFSDPDGNGWVVQERPAGT
jgi:catechol 2,3-dioxygenase-like lactoylglutathione lyase family enzyme